MKKGLIIIGILVGLIITAGYFLYNIPVFSPDVTVKKLVFNKPQSTLYLKSEYWGVSADHSIASLSTDPISGNKPNPYKDYIYNEADYVFYRTSNDTLWLYVFEKSKVPVNFNSRVKIIQVELDNKDMMNVYHTHVIRNKKVFKFSINWTSSKIYHRPLPV